MKKYKFRAWNKAISKMLSWEEVIAYSNDQFHIVETVDFFEDDELEIMQYAGVKDKNGKEIYEGDIVKTKRENYIYNAGGMTETKEYIQEVKYPFFIGCGQAFGGVDGTKSIRDIVEIIGNIYENPELMK